MSRVQQCAGGGKLTVEGLIPAVVQQGKTVTIKQGSKVVQSVTGSLAIRKVFVGSITPPNFDNNTYTLSATSVPGWQHLTADNFCVEIINESLHGGYYPNLWRGRKMPAFSYNANNGIITFSNVGWAQDNVIDEKYYGAYIKLAINVYAYILG